MSEAHQAAGFPGYPATGGCQQRGMSDPEAAPPSHVSTVCFAGRLCLWIPALRCIHSLRRADTTAAAAPGHGGFVPTPPGLGLLPGLGGRWEREAGERGCVQTDVTWRCWRKHHLQEKAVKREFLLTLLCPGAKLPLIECRLAALPEACRRKLLA